MNENTTEGPLTATVGERLGEKAHLAQEAVGRGRRAEVRFPWVAVLAGSAVWVLVRTLTRGVGRFRTRGWRFRMRGVGRRFQRRRRR